MWRSAFIRQCVSLPTHMHTYTHTHIYVRHIYAISHNRLSRTSRCIKACVAVGSKEELL